MRNGSRFRSSRTRSLEVTDSVIQLDEFIDHIMLQVQLYVFALPTSRVSITRPGFSRFSQAEDRVVRLIRLLNSIYGFLAA